ncbi:MAG: MFS transporter, partial [Vicinamibacterales bacterium]
IPQGVPPTAAESARDSLGGAAQQANLLPDPLGAQLLDASREAFVQALQVTAALSAAVMLATAIMAAVLLRNIRPPAAPDEQAVPEPEPLPSRTDRILQEEPAA